MIFKAPELLKHGNSSFCPGCGHGTVGRLVYENAIEMGYEESIITALDVACCSLFMYSSESDFVGTAHGRVLPTAVGIKKVRKDNLVIAYNGDGACYSIGMAHLMWSALRNDNITVIVVNNQVFGMTGGQMAPTTLEGQRTTSSPMGRDTSLSGEPFDVVKVLGELNIAYLARGSVDSPVNINKTKKYIKQGMENQMNKKGFSLIEVLSPCPTNWGMRPVAAIEHMRNTVLKAFVPGEYVKEGKRL